MDEDSSDDEKAYAAEMKKNLKKVRRAEREKEYAEAMEREETKVESEKPQRPQKYVIKEHEDFRGTSKKAKKQLK